MPSQPEELTLRDYLRPLIERKWLVLLIVVVCTGGVYAYYAQKTKTYVASTRILVTPTANPLDANTDVSDRALQDQAALLTSRDVASTVAKRMGRAGQGADLASSVSAEASSGSDFLLITARRSSAKDAADVANRFADAFIRLRASQERSRLQQALTNARTQLAQLRGPGTAADRANLQDTIRQLQLTNTAASGSATQVDPASPPGSPVAPHTTRATALAFVLSLLGGIGMAYAVEALDRRPKRLEEFAPLYGMPILAVIPEASEVTSRDDGLAALTPEFKEPLRQLRTNIQLAALDRPIKRILVTSAIAGEGKSTVVRNLAIVLREGGLRVAVVDSDLRRPALARLFEQRSQPGLIDVLSGRQPLREALVDVPVQVRGLGTLARIGAVETAQSNHGADGDPSANGASISFLAAGPAPPDPQPVLAAERTRSLLEDVGTDHDVVLIDSPPLLHVTDAIALAAWADAVIVVARLGEVTRDNAKRLSEMVRGVPNANPIGVVLNVVPPAEGVAYGYAYGYEED